MKRLSTLDLKAQKEKIVASTAYDVIFARLLDDLVDVVLVGDSLGMVIQGKENTLNVTIEQMVYHTEAVHRGLKKAHLVSDMPFLSYTTPEKALENAGKLLKAGAQSVKLEGGEEVAPIVKRLTEPGIPVMGHIGLTPQSINRFGGYRVQGRDAGCADQMVRDAKCLEASGAYAIVLESVPSELAATITAQTQCATIGIGAGAACNGQILVAQDLLGMDLTFTPKFLKRYANLSESIRAALQTYAEDVRSGRYPSEEYSYK